MEVQNQEARLQTDAQNAYQAGDFRLAAENYAQAADILRQKGDLLTAAELNNNQSVALLRAGDAKAAWKACDGTDLVFGQAGDTHRQALALGNQAAALEGTKNWKEAIAKYEQSAMLFEKAGDKELLSLTLQSLSALQLKHHQQFDAMASMQGSLAAKPKLTAKDNILRRLIRLVFQLIQRVPGG